MEKKFTYGLIILLLLFYTVAKAENSEDNRVIIGTISHIYPEKKTVVILNNLKNLQIGQVIFADTGERTIELEIIALSDTEIVCKIPEDDLELLDEEVEIYILKSAEELNSAEKYNDEKMKKEKAEESRRYRRQRPKPVFFTGVIHNTNNFWRGSDFYGEKAGVTEAYVNVLIESMYFHAGYENPGLNFFNSKPENYKALNLSGSYRHKTDLPVQPYFRLNYKYLPDAEKVNTSNFLTGTVGVSYSMMPASLGFSYSRDYYTDDLNSDRETFKDYMFRSNFSLYSNDFILSNIYLVMNISAGYFNNRFADSKATPEDESRKGISDITGHLALNIQLTDEMTLFTEYNYAYMPDSDWSRYAKTRNWYGLGLHMKL